MTRPLRKKQAHCLPNSFNLMTKLPQALVCYWTLGPLVQLLTWEVWFPDVAIPQDLCAPVSSQFCNIEAYSVFITLALLFLYPWFLAELKSRILPQKHPTGILMGTMLKIHWIIRNFGIYTQWRFVSIVDYLCPLVQVFLPFIKMDLGRELTILILITRSMKVGPVDMSTGGLQITTWLWS